MTKMTFIEIFIKLHQILSDITGTTLDQRRYTLIATKVSKLVPKAAAREVSGDKAGKCASKR